MIKDKNQPYKKCTSCGEEFNLGEFMNKSYQVVYYRCVACRRFINGLDVDKYRAKKKAQKKNLDASPASAVPNQTGNPDLYIKIEQYIISYLGAICGPCGYNKCVPMLELYSTNVDIRKAIQIYVYNPNKQSWADIVNIISDCVVICPTCKKMTKSGYLTLFPIMFEHNTDNIPYPPTEYLNLN